MTPSEVQRFLDEQKVITVATIGRDGRPHLAPLWYLPIQHGLTTWTYGSSQKVVNLRRLPQATVLIESGDTYESLRGLSIEADVQVVEEVEAVTEIGIALAQRYSGARSGDPVPETVRESVAAQAVKRVGLIFTPTKTISWDHAKLGGVY